MISVYAMRNGGVCGPVGDFKSVKKAKQEAQAAANGLPCGGYVTVDEWKRGAFVREIAKFERADPRKKV